MRAVVGRRQPVAPVMLARRQPQARVGRHGVIVLALGVGDAADLAGPVQPAHLLAEDRVAVVLGQHVDAAGALHRPAERHALRDGAVGRRLAEDVLAGVQGLDRERPVLVEVVGQDHRVQVVLQERVVVRVGGDPAGPAGRLQPLLPHVADGDQLHPHGVRGALDEALAAADSDHADAYPALVHEYLPGAPSQPTRCRSARTHGRRRPALSSSRRAACPPARVEDRSPRGRPASQVPTSSP